MMTANTPVVVLLSIALVVLMCPIPVQAVSGSGVGTITVVNHPPSILSIMIVAAGNNSIGLSVTIHEPDSLVDVDRVVVHISSFDEHGSLSFEWVRRGSKSVPNYCGEVSGCWHELIPGHRWTNTHTSLVAVYHDAISARITTGTWSFTFHPTWSSLAGISGSWSFEVHVYDRSGATAMTNGSLQFPNP
jgi:hypothetical protein